MKDSTMYYNTWNKDSMEYGDSYTTVEPKKYTTSPTWTYSTKSSPCQEQYQLLLR